MVRVGASHETQPASATVFLPVLLLFVGSGCSALIYEIVWFQMLRLVIGSSAVSLGVLLGTFMGGMCLGSLAFSRIVSVRCHPLRVYALLELGIGGLGFALLFVLPLAGHAYTSFVGSGMPGFLLRACVCTVGLLPPTVLMGATLPAIARWVKTTPEGVARLGFFYGANILGAVFGCLLAGFYLLRVYDVVIATYVAVSINAAVAAIGLALAAVSGYETTGDGSASAPRDVGRDQWTVYLAIALSGMSALGAEVVWTRLLSLMLGATVYTFSIILAVFLVGLGIGSSVGSMLARASTRPRVVLGLCQLLLTGAIAWSAYALCVSLPYWPIDVTLSTSPWMLFQLDLMRCAWAILPAACLWGASFPLALAAASVGGQDPARWTGRVYAANTLGAILGSLLFSMSLISWLGTQRAQQCLILLSATAALLMFATSVVTVFAASNAERERRFRGCWLGVLGVVGLLGSTITLVWSVPPASAGLIGYGRNLPTYRRLPEFVYVAEGMNASIAVSEFSDGVRNFHVSGKVVASSDSQDMRLQRMLCHLPALMHSAPKSALIVGCGAGVTAGSFTIHPDMQRIVICEIESSIPPAAGVFFAAENHDVMCDPRVQVVCDDARHYILTSNERFDIITSDPIHPWVKGAASLYSKEYFELCRRRLNPGGIVTQWVPLYESNVAAVKSQIATFFEVFPEGTIWSNDIAGEGYDVVLLGQVTPTMIDLDHLQQRINRSDHHCVLMSLEEVDLGSALGLAATYAGRARDLRNWTEGAQINDDRNLRLQYLAGMGLNRYESEAIFDSIVAYRTYPQDMFIATGLEGRALRVLLDGPPQKDR
jgi:spermidine synthase